MNAISNETILNEIKTMEPELLSWFRTLHENPEIETELPMTTAFVTEKLHNMGICARVLKNGGGIVADIGKKGPLIAIRADMDALDVKEETGLSYSSKNSYMHACGHDAHTAMLLTVARFLKSHEAELGIRIRLLFQASEELLTGAKLMVEEGVLTDPVPDRILALHAGILCGSGYPSGSLVLKKGLSFFSSDSFRITVRGKGGHAASPHLSIDPIVCAARIIEALQTLVSREAAPTIPAVISVTHIESGAKTFNVIPGEAVMMGGIRTGSYELRDYLKKRAPEVCRLTAEAMGAEAEMEFLFGCPPLLCEEKTTDTVYDALSDLFPEDVRQMEHPNSGSEDASYFFEQVPGCYFFLVSYPKDADTLYPHHHAKFCLDASVLWKGAAALVCAALSLK